ncbi:helix-turn-helix domain-containing protein [uncultured Kordia sp.]|uniref:helix-turn-helix domain-containing protein n=1 Tax=uncultured Kordia sp. TaxID=507699 RepID=UPI00345BB376
MQKAIKLKIRIGTTALTICTLELTAKAPPKKGYPIAPVTYGDYFKQARMDYGYTQVELAMELEVYKSTIDKWERNATIPNYINKQKIKTFFGFDPVTETITI